jgi:hypothetical protein
MDKRQKNRCYTTGSNRRMFLVSWICRRCVICKRFLTKKQQKYCKKHGLKKFRQRRWREKLG